MKNCKGAMSLLLSACTLLLCATLAQCKVVYVRTDGSDYNHGLSWTLAKKTLAAGITASISGDQIWVAKGLYFESITLKSGVGLYGGFAGTETALNQRNWSSNATIIEYPGYVNGEWIRGVVIAPVGATGSTVIDGFTVRNSDTGIYCTLASPTITNNTISNCMYGIYCCSCSPSISNNQIVGCSSMGIRCDKSSATITGNSVDGTSKRDIHGTGIYCENTSSPTIRGNTITGNRYSGIIFNKSSGIVDANIISKNTGEMRGAGIYCEASSNPSITGNTIADNRMGSGIDCKNSSPSILNNNIIGNYNGNGAGGIILFYSSSLVKGNIIRWNSGSSGGAISCGASSPTISGNIMSGNTASANGGGISCNGAATISNNFITDNCAYGDSYGGDGGGIYCSSSSATITNNTIARNIAVRGAGVFCLSSSPVISNTIIAFNTSGIFCSGGTPVLNSNCVYNPDGTDYTGLAPGSLDISVDPRFVSVEYGDFHIRPISPCCGAGWNGALGIGTADIDGQARVQPSAGVVDIGADECDGVTRSASPIVVRVDGANGNDANDGSTWSLAKKTIQAGIDRASGYAGEVWVKTGKYTESLKLRPYAQVYGGFQGNEASRGDRCYVPVETIIYGSGGIYVSPGCRGVTLSGFSICNSTTFGISCGNYSSPTIANNSIRFCAGSGIVCRKNSSPIITNNTIVENITNGDGGGISVDASASPVISNNIIAFNSNGIYNRSGGNPVTRNNCVYNPSDYNYSGLSAGVGDIFVDPKFAGPKCGNFHIQSDSPCKDAGLNDASGIGTIDGEGQPRVMTSGGIVDIGADESDGTIWVMNPIIVRVDGENGDDSNDGSSWASAKKTMQAAIDTVSVQGGEVWVKAGLYKGCINLKACVDIYGGFAGTEASREARNWKSNETILDGCEQGTVVTIANAGTQLTSVDGFTIRNGRAQIGGGICCSASSSTIKNNLITGNYASYGGGVSGGWSSIITNNTIKGNIAERAYFNGIGGDGGEGGGIKCERGIISNNIITENVARDLEPSYPEYVNGFGGGISCAGATIYNNIISRNSALSIPGRGHGGGVYGGGSTLLNNTIVHNFSTAQSGGIRMQGYGTIANNIVAFNSSGISGPTNLLTLKNNCVYNPDGLNYSGVSAGAGDISSSPQFLADWLADYRLRPTSPCIGSGDNSVVPDGSVDFDGKPRILPAGGTVDMGCIEWVDAPYFIQQLGHAKAMPEQITIEVQKKPVTAAFDGSFYIEEPNRTSGLRVISDSNVTPGTLATVSGHLELQNGERALHADSVFTEVGGSNLIPSSLFMPGRSIGGGSFFWNFGGDNCGQKGIDGGFGLNNIGLLVRTSGAFEYVNDHEFTVTDGSGIPVKCITPSNVFLSGDWTNVRVTGISSCEIVGEELHRLIRVRTQSDIVSY